MDYSGYSEFLQRQSRAWQVQAIAGILMGRGFPMSCAALERGSANHHKFAKINIDVINRISEVKYDPKSKSNEFKFSNLR